LIFTRRLRWLWLTLAVVFLDRASKAWIETRSAEYFPHVVRPKVLSIVYARNSGIAFSLFAGLSSPTVRVILILGSLAVIGVIAWLLVAGREANPVNVAGLALLLGGATGNVTDRIIHGAVTDFLEVWLPFLPWRIFNPWPTFNVADSAVTFGAILIAFDVLFCSQRPVHSQEK
jgi:signal peptidase II